MRLTLLSYDDDVMLADRTPEPFHRFVSFGMRAEKDGWLPAWFTPILVRLEDCRRDSYVLDSVSDDGFMFTMFWFGGSEEGDVFYQIPTDARPCRLIYQPGLGKVEFIFR